jgi:hypothetical protein
MRDCDFSGAIRRPGFVPGPGGALIQGIGVYFDIKGK